MIVISTNLKKGAPFSRVAYTSGSGLAANSLKVHGDGLGAILGSFRFNLKNMEHNITLKVFLNNLFYLYVI